MKCYYFGAWDGTGHYLYLPSMRRSYAAEIDLPFAVHILDSGLLPPSKEQKEGILHRAVINGWTVVAFWDRSSDTRFSSNSAFIVDSNISTLEVLEMAKTYFPQVLGRINFPLT